MREFTERLLVGVMALLIVLMILQALFQVIVAGFISLLSGIGF